MKVACANLLPLLLLALVKPHLAADDSEDDSTMWSGIPDNVLKARALFDVLSPVASVMPVPPAEGGSPKPFRQQAAQNFSVAFAADVNAVRLAIAQECSAVAVIWSNHVTMLLWLVGEPSSSSPALRQWQRRPLTQLPAPVPR